ncbi:hypothetical protein PAXRUDRAFT_124028, partial [Paxillus rubicundulus Ve08.2h10]
MPSPQHLHDIYASLLIPRDTSRGYPLWNPEPNSELPEVCRDEGLRLGDVGIVKDGNFDVLFNILLPREHPVNQWSGVPTTFRQVPTLPRDFSKLSGYDNHGYIISSKSVRTSVVVNVVAPVQFFLDSQFTPPSEKGAILILPEGGGYESLLNLRAVSEEARANGESWYRYAYLERGLTAINNDSLFLITGFHKASSW